MTDVTRRSSARAFVTRGRFAGHDVTAGFMGNRGAAGSMGSKIIPTEVAVTKREEFVFSERVTRGLRTVHLKRHIFTRHRESRHAFRVVETFKRSDSLLYGIFD